MSIRISSGSELDFLLHHSDHRDQLNAQELWLSSFEGVTELTGAYAKHEPTGPRKAVASAVKPWRQLAQYLAQQCGPDRPLNHLALHCTAQQLINRDVLTREGNAAKNELLKTRAAKTHVKRLTLSGQCRDDSYWPFLRVSECITLRGCRHAIRDAFWWGLIKLETDPPILRIEFIGPIGSSDVGFLMRDLIWVQRIRHLIGMQRFIKSGNGRLKAEDFPPGTRHFARVMVLTQLDEPLPTWLTEETWNEDLPKVYTTGTQFTVHNIPRHESGPSAISGIPELEKQLFTKGPSHLASARVAADSSVPSNRTACLDHPDQTLVDEEFCDQVSISKSSPDKIHLTVTPVSHDAFDSYSHGALCPAEDCKCGPFLIPPGETDGPDLLDPSMWLQMWNRSDCWSSEEEGAVAECEIEAEMEAWDLLRYG